MKIKPLGNRILVLPVKKGNYITETNIELVDNTLATAEVVEFAPMFEGVYKKEILSFTQKMPVIHKAITGKVIYGLMVVVQQTGWYGALSEIQMINK